MLATFYFKNLSAAHIYLHILREANYGAQYYYFFEIIYILFFMKRMNPFIEGSKKNRFGPPAGMIWKFVHFDDFIILFDYILSY